jgi:ankyrin repeat protein
MPRIREDWFEAERLIRAAQEGDIASMQRFAAEGCDLNLMDEISKGALHYAVEAEHYKAVRWLLETGANVNLHDPNAIGETALSLAARGTYPEMVSLLLQHGADPDIPGWVQQTARTRAQARRDAEGVEICALIERHHPSKPNPGSSKR